MMHLLCQSVKPETSLRFTDFWGNKTAVGKAAVIEIGNSWSFVGHWHGQNPKSSEPA